MITWIPIAERLPEPNQEVLWIDFDRSIESGCYLEHKRIVDFYRCIVKITEFTHWAEINLPEQAK